jgi:hypothetical protein
LHLSHRPCHTADPNGINMFPPMIRAEDYFSS